MWGLLGFVSLANEQSIFISKLGRDERDAVDSNWVAFQKPGLETKSQCCRKFKILKKITPPPPAYLVDNSGGGGDLRVIVGGALI